MGVSYVLICQNCNNQYRLNKGPGMLFHFLRCKLCGQETRIDMRTVNDAQLGPNYEGIDKLVGKCSCGGDFAVDAEPRCPECGSDKYEPEPEGHGTYLFD